MVRAGPFVIEPSISVILTAPADLSCTRLVLPLALRLLNWMQKEEPTGFSCRSTMTSPVNPCWTLVLATTTTSRSFRIREKLITPDGYGDSPKLEPSPEIGRK